MFDPTAIILISDGIKALKTLYEGLPANKHPEAIKALNEMESKILDLQRSSLKLETEYTNQIHELRSKNTAAEKKLLEIQVELKRLTDITEFKNSLEHESMISGCYKQKDSEARFCANCLDSHNRIAPLVLDKDGGYWRCKNKDCHQHYENPNYTPPELPRQAQNDYDTFRY